MLANFQKHLKPQSVFSYLLIPAGMLAALCAAFAFFSYQQYAESVNYFFTLRLAKYLLVLLAGIVLLFLLALWLHRGERALIQPARAKISAADLLLVLLPLTPVAQFVIKNQDILEPADSAIVLGFFALFAGIVIILIPWLLGRFSSTRLLMMVNLAFAFTITSMSSISQYFHWFNQGTLSKQALFFGFVFVTAWFLSLPKTKKYFLALITLSFIVNSVVQFANSRQPLEQPANVSDSFMESQIAKKKPVTTPNIYLLVYDGYTHAETMAGYGIDNSAQEDFLREKGFVIYPHAYSIGPTTLHSMSSTLNHPYANNKSGREIVSGEGSVQNIMRYLGYKTVGIFPTDYMFRGVGAHYDEFFPPARSSYPNLISAIIMGEFRFDVGFYVLKHGVFVARKRSAFQEASTTPVFLYTHSNFPNHSQNSGQCLPDETETWKTKLATANAEMREDIDLLAKLQPQAVIIVAGDHGPNLTKGCFDTAGVYPASEITRLDIQDRYGAFLAIRWPAQDYSEYDHITVLQDIFPTILAYMYRDADLEKTKIDALIDQAPAISGVSVQDGIIIGGADDGEPLFLSGK